MIIPTTSDIRMLEKATHDAGYHHYSITKKPSAMKSYSRSHLVPNPFLIVKNKQTNRILQVKWVGDFQAVVKSTIAQIKDYETRCSKLNTAKQ